MKKYLLWKELNEYEKKQAEEEFMFLMQDDELYYLLVDDVFFRLEFLETCLFEKFNDGYIGVDVIH